MAEHIFSSELLGNSFQMLCLQFEDLTINQSDNICLSVSNAHVVERRTNKYFDSICESFLTARCLMFSNVGPSFTVSTGNN